jgi:hypothetical protein
MLLFPNYYFNIWKAIMRTTKQQYIRNKTSFELYWPFATLCETKFMRWFLLIYFIIIITYHCTGGTLTATFTKVLTIYHRWILPSIILLYLPIPRIVSTGLMFPFTHMYTVFAPYSPSHTLSSPPPPHWYQYP